ncbi:response regulator transcription factor [Planctomycetota bacterium]
MANNRLLGKQSDAFAGSKPITTKTRSVSVKISRTGKKSPDLDKFLEKTLNNIKTTAPLTKRESEILRLIVEGKTNKKIAQILYRTERTVEYHRNRLMRKLGAKTAADLVRRAITLGITS